MLCEWDEEKNQANQKKHDALDLKLRPWCLKTPNMFLSKTGWTQVESSLSCHRAGCLRRRPRGPAGSGTGGPKGKEERQRNHPYHLSPRSGQASAKSTVKKALNQRQIAVLARIEQRQAAGDDSAVNYQDVPALSDEQLAKAFRPRDNN